MENTNDSLDKIRTQLLQQLSDLQGAPSVQMQEVPPPFRKRAKNDKMTDEDFSRKQHSSELYDKVD